MSSVMDILFIVIVLFATGLAVMFSVFAGHQINSALGNQSTINASSEAVDVLASSDAAIDMMDYIYLVAFIAFFISLLVFGWIVGGTPIAAPIYFFVLIIFVFVAVIIQFVWVDISVSLSYMLVSLPITNFILSKIGYFTAVFGLSAILVMFAKPREGL